jgi:hypothetical protein
MSVSTKLATPPEAAAYERLELLGDRGWSIAITGGCDGVRITARRGDHVEQLDCRNVAEGALELYDALYWR